MKKLPHIILIILDSARRDMFGCYGNKEGLTPYIDEFSRQCALFMDHYAAGCGSAQAHVGIFTGQHSMRHKMFHNLCHLREDIVTLPKLLKGIGYKTYGYTKFDIVPPAGYGNIFGFDELIYPEKKRAQGAYEETFSDALKRTISRFPYLKKTIKAFLNKVSSKDAKLRSWADSLDGASCLDYILGKVKDNRDTPVFAYTTLLHPHTPYYPPQQYLKRVLKGKKIHKLSYDIQLDVHAYLNGDFGPAKEALESVRDCYKADLLYADSLIGSFLRRLREEKLLKESLIVIMSDHGELLGEHDEMNHGGTVWDEIFSTPCMLHYPEKIRRDTRINRLTSAMDIAPSILDAIGKLQWAEKETVFDGVSVFLDNYDWDNRYLVVDSPPTVLPGRLKNYPRLMKKSHIIARALRTKAHKYIWQSNNRNYLFSAGRKEDKVANLLTKEARLEKDFLKKMTEFYEGMDKSFKLDEYPIRLSKSTAGKMANPFIRQELVKLGYLNEKEL